MRPCTGHGKCLNSTCKPDKGVCAPAVRGRDRELQSRRPLRKGPIPAVPHLASCRTSLLGQTAMTVAVTLASCAFRPHVLHVCAFFCHLAPMSSPLRLAFDLHFSQMAPKCAREAVRVQCAQEAQAALLHIGAGSSRHTMASPRVRPHCANWGSRDDRAPKARAGRRPGASTWTPWAAASFRRPSGATPSAFRAEILGCLQGCRVSGVGGGSGAL